MRQQFLVSLDNNTLTRDSELIVSSDGHTCKREFLTLQCLDCGATRPVRTGSLDRTCKMCAKILFKRMFDKYADKIASYPDLKLLTLTSKPVPKQSKEFVRLLFSWLQRLFDRKKYSSWVGRLAVLEHKKQSNGRFYYHVHVVLSGGFVNQSQISEDWEQISGCPVVDIRKIWRTKRKAVAYILKYLAKGGEGFSVVDNEDFKEIMFRTRYVHSYGEWYGLKDDRVRIRSVCRVCGGVDFVIFEYFNGLIDLREGAGYQTPPGWVTYVA